MAADGPGTCDVFVRSYWRDFDWLPRCLEAIGAFARGFRETIVVVPRSSRSRLRKVALPPGVRVEACPDYRDDYLGQQVTKLTADSYTDADFVCHLDSDCILSRPVTPGDLIVDGAPVVATLPYAQLGRHWPWRGPTESFLLRTVEHDFMQRPPFVYPRWLYGELREFAQSGHGVDLETYVTSRPPRGFSEFNALGAFAEAEHPDRFAWVDASDCARFCRWFWSWARADRDAQAEIDRILAGAG